MSKVLIECRLGAIVLCFSPTRGIQLARAMLDSYSQRTVLHRIGGPANLIEESPDILHDASPIAVLELSDDGKHLTILGDVVRERGGKDVSL